MERSPDHPPIKSGKPPRPLTGVSSGSSVFPGGSFGFPLLAKSGGSASAVFAISKAMAKPMRLSFMVYLGCTFQDSG
jgi:hypothetical protein